VASISLFVLHLILGTRRHGVHMILNIIRFVVDFALSAASYIRDGVSCLVHTISDAPDIRDKASRLVHMIRYLIVRCIYFMIFAAPDIFCRT